MSNKKTVLSMWTNITPGHGVLNELTVGPHSCCQPGGVVALPVRLLITVSREMLSDIAEPKYTNSWARLPARGPSCGWMVVYA